MLKDWRSIIEEWLGNDRLTTPFHDDLLFLFERALANTTLPEESGFGFPPRKHSLGVFYRNLMLVGVFGRTLEVIVDEDLGNRIGYRTRVVGTSVRNGPLLYWVTSDIRDVGAIARIPTLWDHYRRATLLAGMNPTIQGNGRNYAKDKVPLNTLIQEKTQFVDSAELDRNDRIAIKRSFGDGRSARLRRLSLAPVKPTSTITQTRSFLRNPDVIVEVLLRADGNCEQCGKPSPFLRDVNGTPYLEVHHTIPLAENGDDTVSNALALCPNCHRHAHHGRSSFGR